MPDAMAMEALDGLRGTVSGPVLSPGDAAYEDVRQVHNGAIDKRPGLIVQCLNTADVVDAVNFARQTGLEVSIRGGGHNVAGLAVCDGGVMIDLSRMKGIHVDPRSRRVRAQGGVLWGEYNRTAGAFGLATTGGVISTTGIAGLTLGGGIGWLMPKYGMALDNLVSAEIVTADGRIRTASADQEPDLFWAIRGAGANFGVATSLEYEAHPLSTIYGGLLAFDLSDAGRAFAAFREACEAGSDDLASMVALVHAADGSGAKIAAVVVCHSGDIVQAERDVQPLRDAAPLLVDMVAPMPYPTMNALLDDGYPRGARNYWRSAFFRELTDEAVDIMVDAFKQSPSAMTSLGVEHFHGQVTRIGPTDTVFPHRQPGYNLILTSVWANPAEDEANIAWTRETFSALAPFMADAVYVNYVEADAVAPQRAAYGPNLERLVELKRRYDPENFFHVNLNVTP